VHELAITQNILDIVLDRAREANATRITRINLVVGELSGVEPDSIQFYFDILKKDNAAEAAVLDCRVVKARLTCRDCSATFQPEQSSWLCPQCGSRNVDIIEGKDSHVESIEVE
jgi:hydrogenase nickel incorporation protein HypA/HybF